MSWLLCSGGGNPEKVADDDEEDSWVKVDDPNEEFVVLSRGEVKDAVNDFVVQCFSTSAMDLKSQGELNDRMLKSAIDRAMIGLRPESTLTRYYKYGKEAYKMYQYAAFACSLAAKPIVMKLIAEYFSGFSVLAYSSGAGVLYWVAGIVSSGGRRAVRAVEAVPSIAASAAGAVVRVAEGTASAGEASALAS